MAGYEDTRQKIISTLMGRPNGTEIQPENHQDYALNMLDYIRGLELIATSTLIGVAESNTTPVQPNNSRVCYIAGVAQNQNVTFENFIGESGNPISVTTEDMEGVFVILMWNTQYWSAQTFSTNIISNFESPKPILYEDLFALWEAGDLTMGMQYIITDYTTTTVQTNTTSAGHDFDIIVTALSSNELSEDAKCVRKAGDTYFANAKLEAWEIKYRIVNDTNRFGWADAANGKGVIYYMKDEWNNECPYDFKNIQFKKSDVFLYTFGGTTDNSLTGGCRHNIMMADIVAGSRLTLNFNTFGTSCCSNMFGKNCTYNTLGDACSNNIFGNNCVANTFGNMCYSNTFGNNCYNNTFGNECDYNTFGYDCGSNSFGDNCTSNTFGDNSYNNIFNNGCDSNTFGNDCDNNTFGNGYIANTFGNGCSYNNFYTGVSGTIKKNYIQFIVLEDGCTYNNFYSELTTSPYSYLQRIRIKGLNYNTTPGIQITLPETNTNYEWVIAGDSSGVIKQYCPEDRLANNYIYKIEDTVVSTWTASTAYTKYPYEAVIPIENITESDTVEVIYSVPDADSNNYAPDGELYEGYIKIFAKVNTEIIIPALIITKIDL